MRQFSGLTDSRIYLACAYLHCTRQHDAENTNFFSHHRAALAFFVFLSPPPQKKPTGCFPPKPNIHFIQIIFCTKGSRIPPCTGRGLTKYTIKQKQKQNVFNNIFFLCAPPPRGAECAGTPPDCRARGRPSKTTDTSCAARRAHDSFSTKPKSPPASDGVAIYPQFFFPGAQSPSPSSTIPSRAIA